MGEPKTLSSICWLSRVAMSTTSGERRPSASAKRNGGNNDDDDDDAEQKHCARRARDAQVGRGEKLAATVEHRQGQPAWRTHDKTQFGGGQRQRGTTAARATAAILIDLKVTLKQSARAAPDKVSAKENPYTTM